MEAEPQLIHKGNFQKTNNKVEGLSTKRDSGKLLQGKWALSRLT